MTSVWKGSQARDRLRTSGLPGAMGSGQGLPYLTSIFFTYCTKKRERTKTLAQGPRGGGCKEGGLSLELGGDI